MHVPSVRLTPAPARAALALLIAALAAGCASAPPSGLGTLGDDPAASGFDAAGDREPTLGSLHSMARLCVAQGRDKDAEQVLRGILEQQPGFLPAYEELAQIYLRSGLLDSAAVVLDLGLQAAPHDPVLLNDLGMCRLLQRDYGAALENFTLAAAAAPTDARCRANMAAALGLLGRADEALSLYLQVVPPADAHWNVALLASASQGADGTADAETR